MNSAYSSYPGQFPQDQFNNPSFYNFGSQGSRFPSQFGSVGQQSGNPSTQRKQSGKK